MASAEQILTSLGERKQSRGDTGGRQRFQDVMAALRAARGEKSARVTEDLANYYQFLKESKDQKQFDAVRRCGAAIKRVKKGEGDADYKARCSNELFNAIRAGIAANVNYQPSEETLENRRRRRGREPEANECNIFNGDEKKCRQEEDKCSWVGRGIDICRRKGIQGQGRTTRSPCADLTRDQCLSDEYKRLCLPLYGKTDLECRRRPRTTEEKKRFQATPEQLANLRAFRSRQAEKRRTGAGGAAGSPAAGAGATSTALTLGGGGAGGAERENKGETTEYDGQDYYYDDEDDEDEYDNAVTSSGVYGSRRYGSPSSRRGSRNQYDSNNYASPSSRRGGYSSPSSRRGGYNSPRSSGSPSSRRGGYASPRNW